MKDKQRNIVGVLIMVILPYAIAFICQKNSIVNVPGENSMLDFQFNIITIVSVFAGFSFTVLGLLISMSSTDAMEKLRETNILSNSCKVITNSIIFFLLSFFVSLYYVLGINNYLRKLVRAVKGSIALFEQIDQILFLYGILLMIIGILLFAFSVYKMVVLMNYIFNDNKKRVQKTLKDYEAAVENFKRKKEKEDMEEDYDKDCF